MVVHVMHMCGYLSLHEPGRGLSVCLCLLRSDDYLTCHGVFSMSWSLMFCLHVMVFFDISWWLLFCLNAMAVHVDCESWCLFMSWRFMLFMCHSSLCMS